MRKGALMRVGYVILWLAVAGSVGGFLNAYFAYQGFVLWRKENLQGGGTIWMPGFLGNVVVGAITAIVLAALYSPLGAVKFAGSSGSTDYDITLASLAGAVLSGLGGSRLLTQEVDRRYDALVKEQTAAAIKDLVNLALPVTPKSTT